jgi:signal transduction histidine kinase
MRRLLVIAALLAVAALAGAAPALAQDDTVEPQPLEWATGDSIDWSEGGILAGFGLMGALFTVFTLVGGAVPGTAGQAEIEADTKRLSLWTDELGKRITNNNPGRASEMEAINASVSELRTAVTRERWRQFVVASVLYILLGAFAATVLAQDLLQAIAIGAGWTAIIGSLGLKRDYSKRIETKDEALDSLKKHIDQLLQRSKAPGEGVTEQEIQPSDEVLKQVEVAKAL